MYHGCKLFYVVVVNHILELKTDVKQVPGSEIRVLAMTYMPFSACPVLTLSTMLTSSQVEFDVTFK